MILIAEWDFHLARTAARIPEQSAQILRDRIMGSGMWQHGLSVSACAFSIPRGSRFCGRSEHALRGLDRSARCTVPCLVLPGDDMPHPAVIGAELAELLPDAAQMKPWKGPEHLDAQVRPRHQLPREARLSLFRHAGLKIRGRSRLNPREAAVKCLRIYASADGESHFGEIEIPTSKKSVHPDAAPFEISAHYPASRTRFTRILAGMSQVTWHTVPERVPVRPKGARPEQGSYAALAICDGVVIAGWLRGLVGWNAMRQCSSQ